MGVPLLDFAANIGKKVFGKGEDSAKASEKLKQHIEKNNPGVSGLKVAGNVEGVGKVEAAGLQGASAGSSVYVLVVEGDTLSGLAERELGSGARYTKDLRGQP